MWMQIKFMYFSLRALASCSSPRKSTASMMEDQVGGGSTLFSHTSSIPIRHMKVCMVFCSNDLQSGHGQMEVDANGFPLVCHFVVEDSCRVF